jgi:hypothetical protein
LHEEHIDPIDVWTFFPIDLDADEMVIEDLRDLRILERLMLHDVAPMASGVTDGEKNGLIFGARFAERLLTPRKPVDWIVGVLE